MNSEKIINCQNVWKLYGNNPEKFINSNQIEENSTANSYSYELGNGTEVKIQRFDDTSFTVTLPK